MYQSTKEKASDIINGTAEELRNNDNIRDAAKATRKQLHSIARETGEKVQEFLTARKDQVQEVREVAEKKIKERPLTSAAVAFAAGMVVARLLKSGK